MGSAPKPLGCSRINSNLKIVTIPEIQYSPELFKYKIQCYPKIPSRESPCERPGSTWLGDAFSVMLLLNLKLRATSEIHLRWEMRCARLNSLYALKNKSILLSLFSQSLY